MNLRSDPILGAETCFEMGLIKRANVVNLDFSESSKSSEIPDDIEAEYHDIFQGIGLLPTKHTIKIDPSVEPVVHPPRRVPIALKEKIKAELDRMVSIVVKQDQPTAWVNSMVTVVKPNGKLRICIDPKNVNTAIRREHYPLNTIEDVVQQTPQAKVFTKLDATCGFWQIGLDEESTKLCTFNTPFGRYSYTRFPFGIVSASEVYQRTISGMIHDLPVCEAIIDDILIWGSDMKEHNERLKAVMQRIRQNDLKLSTEKCEFRKERRGSCADIRGCETR